MKPILMESEDRVSIGTWKIGGRKVRKWKRRNVLGFNGNRERGGVQIIQIFSRWTG